jgi:hypothetical protein
MTNVHKVVAPEPYVQYRGPNGLPDETIFDASGQTFYQSATSNPDPYGPESYTGPDATPRQIYPVRPATSRNLTWRGGRIVGRHPIDVDVAVYEKQNAPADQPYVNSAALLMDSGSAEGPSLRQTVEGVRIVNVWDGIRFASYYGNHESPPGEFQNFVEGCWLSGALDDAIENDHAQSLMMTDCLFEDFFVLVSARSTTGVDHSALDTIAIDACALKVAPRVYNTGNYPGTYFICPYKANAQSPKVTMKDSILALSGVPNPEPGKIGMWTTLWSKFTDLGGNRLLYLEDGVMPGSDRIGVVPKGFEKLTGQAARTAWAKSREAWLADHFEAFGAE